MGSLHRAWGSPVATVPQAAPSPHPQPALRWDWMPVWDLALLPSAPHTYFEVSGSPCPSCAPCPSPPRALLCYFAPSPPTHPLPHVHIPQKLALALLPSPFLSQAASCLALCTPPTVTHHFPHVAKSCSPFHQTQGLSWLPQYPILWAVPSESFTSSVQRHQIPDPLLRIPVMPPATPATTWLTGHQGLHCPTGQGREPSRKTVCTGARRACAWFPHTNNSAWIQICFCNKGRAQNT